MTRHYRKKRMHLGEMHLGEMHLGEVWGGPESEKTMCMLTRRFFY
jgi:hypothetical protein